MAYIRSICWLSNATKAVWMDAMPESVSIISHYQAVVLGLRLIWSGLRRHPVNAT